MSPPFRAPVLVLAVATSLSGCDSIFGPGSDRRLQYVVERFEVVEEGVDESPIPITYLVGEVGIINTGPDATEVEFSPCGVPPEAFAPDEPDRPVWRSQAHGVWPRSSPFVCAGMRYAQSVGPGDTLRIETMRRPLAGILADSLPVGSYDFEATIDFGPGPVRIDFGTVTLPTSRHPLSDRTVLHNGFRYEIEIEDVGAGSAGELGVDLRVTHSASTDRELERELLSACPVRLLAFREADEVTTIPVPEPVWSWPETCPPGAESVALGPDETRTFARQIDFEEVGGMAGPGRYHLMGVIEVDGRAIRLAAGEVTVPQ